MIDPAYRGRRGNEALQTRLLVLGRGSPFTADRYLARYGVDRSMMDRAGWLTQITCSVHSGYDFGYFVKLLTGQSLPTNEETFFDTLHTWFPTIYDIKFVMRSCKVLKGGLQDVADDLGVRPRSHGIVMALTAAAHTRNVSARRRWCE